MFYGILIRLDDKADLIVNNSSKDDNACLKFLTRQICNVTKFIHHVHIGFSKDYMEIPNLLNPHKQLLCICLITEFSKTAQLFLHALALTHKLIDLSTKFLGSRLQFMCNFLNSPCHLCRICTCGTTGNRLDAAHTRRNPRLTDNLE